MSGRFRVVTTAPLKNVKPTSVDILKLVSLSIPKSIELSTADNDGNRVNSRVVNINGI
ncbi:MAG: hypothetical protein O6940_03735 [Ignavibacteria bacterium]|nr:hypothetical protein [Ignavibacteria bacterium]